MATGTLVTESMVVGSGLHGLDVVLRGIERVEAADLSDGQRAAGIPDRWTLLRFDVDDGKAPAFAEAARPRARRARLVRGPAHGGRELRRLRRSRVPLPDGRPAGRAAAEAHARKHGVPEPQIDWP